MANELKASLSVRLRSECLNKLVDVVAWCAEGGRAEEKMNPVNSIYRMRADVARARADVARAIERLKYFAELSYEDRESIAH